MIEIEQPQVPELTQQQDCRCDGVIWGSWSTCSGTCGPGTRERTRNCLAAKNGGVACHSDPLLEDQFTEMQQEKCTHEQRCPRSIVGEWSPYGDTYIPCRMKCEHRGTQLRRRECIFPNIPDFTYGFDHKISCPGNADLVYDGHYNLLKMSDCCQAVS